MQDAIQGIQDGENDEDFDLEAASASLEAAIEAVAEQSENITDERIYDTYRVILNNASQVPLHLMRKVSDTLTSAIVVEVDAAISDLDQADVEGLASHKRPLEIYAFLIDLFAISIEKVRNPEDDPASPVKPKGRRGRGGKAGAGRAKTAAAKNQDTSTWMDDIPGFLEALAKVLKFKISRIWTTPTERDTFINCITKPAYRVCEKEVYMKSKDVRMRAYKVICTAVKQHGHAQAAHTNIIQMLQFHEFLAEPLAECLSVLVNNYEHSPMVDEVLRSISSMTFSGQDSKTPRTVSKFLVALTGWIPRTVHRNMALVQAQQDSDAYPVRMALLEVNGMLIKEVSENGEANNMDEEQRKKQINQLFDVLFERLLDTSSYVRAKALTILARCCDNEGGFVVQRLDMAKNALGALEDKVASVRKNAIALLTKLITTHPYIIKERERTPEYEKSLDLKVWEEKYKKVKRELIERFPKVAAIAEGDQDEDVEEEDEGEAAGVKKERASSVDSEDGMDVDDEEAAPRRKPLRRKSTTNFEADMEEQQQALAQLDTEEAKSLRMEKQYCFHAIKFITYLEQAMEVACQLLGSTHKTEVLESMEFFQVAHEKEMQGAQAGVKQMLHLIWSRDNASTGEDGKEVKGVRPKLLECYRTMYFVALGDTTMTPIEQVNRITKNTIELTYNASLAELISLEEMLKALMEDGTFHADIVNRLWNVYSADKDKVLQRQRRGSIIILGMLAIAKRSVVTEKLDLLLGIGLGKLGKADLMLARYTCVALQRFSGSAKKIKGSLDDKNIRLEMDNIIFQRLREVILQPCRDRDWFGLAEQVINTIYALGEQPDDLCSDIIKVMTKRVFDKPKRDAATEEKETDPDAMDEDPPADAPEADAASQPANGTTGLKDTADAFELSQLLFVVGHVAMKQIVFLEIIEREMKRQKDVAAAEEKAQAKAGHTRTASKDIDEIDAVVGNAEDEIGERIATVRESELLYGPQSLLSMFGPMLVFISGSPQKFKSEVLRATATLSLSKFLCVSAQFCEQNYQMLFRILEKSRHSNVRSNIAIALGDVAVSFSTIIDESNNELYKGLNDEDHVVKKNTLMVLTHLILNGMIKVKGQLGEMAKCVEDPDRRISDLAKLFFTELSTKQNTIYNNLPDVISHLSTGEHAVDEETFQNILKYVFNFIEKEKQAESIIEKLCQRFRHTDDPRQWRDIAYCLSLLPYKSERSVKKLIEGLTEYKEKLHEPQVFERFTEILTKARQNKSKDKPDTELDEFEKLLDELKQQGEEDQALESRAQKNKKKAAKKRAGTGTRKSTRTNTKKKARSSSADDEEAADLYMSE